MVNIGEQFKQSDKNSDTFSGYFVVGTKPWLSMGIINFDVGTSARYSFYFYFKQTSHGCYT
jgi:hypothetical protein